MHKKSIFKKFKTGLSLGAPYLSFLVMASTTMDLASGKVMAVDPSPEALKSIKFKKTGDEICFENGSKLVYLDCISDFDRFKELLFVLFLPKDCKEFQKETFHFDEINYKGSRLFLDNITNKDTFNHINQYNYLCDSLYDSENCKKIISLIVSI